MNFEYDPREGDSTSKNINHFKKFAEEVGLTDSELIAEVETLLTLEGTGSDQGLLQDLDMAALAVPAEEYAQLIQEVRKEYHFLSDDAYKSLRKKILQSFLLIPNIFSTDAFRERFESQARSNIESEVAAMGKL
ncbi:hypothetical protein B566_EDAN007577 [Ephemera danica]|nr:hypothetical protein B566_EDAN007577 [Ephemera danica]